MHSIQSTFAPRGTRLLRHAGSVMAALSLSIATAFAAPTFDQPAADFKGRLFSAGALPGAEATLSGYSFEPGQKVMLYRAGEALNDGQPITVGEKGAFETKIAIPANAVPGLHPIAVSVANPAAAAVYDLKVVKKIELTGQDRFDVTRQKLVQGLYQVAYSPKTDKLFVTSAVGRPPVKASELLRLNAQTLAVEASTQPGAAPDRQDGHLLAVYGVGVDDANGNVWVTNTRQDTVAVYKQSDLKLVKQFPNGVAHHAFEIEIDQKLNKAYVSGPGKNLVEVFDSKKLASVGEIAINSQSDKAFSTMALALDPAAHKLYVVSGTTSEAAIIDTRTDKVEKVLSVPGLKGGAGVAVDPKGKRLFLVGQVSDNLLIVDLESGKVLHDVAVGQGALRVAFDAKSGNAFVVTRGAGTVAVVNAKGELIGNLEGGTFPNHVIADDRGDVFVINKSRGADDAQGDRISRIVPKK